MAPGNTGQLSFASSHTVTRYSNSSSKYLANVFDSAPDKSTPISAITATASALTDVASVPALGLEPISRKLFQESLSHLGPRGIVGTQKQNLPAPIPRFSGHCWPSFLPKRSDVPLAERELVGRSLYRGNRSSTFPDVLPLPDRLP